LCRSCALDICLVDGTYELFRHYFGLPSAKASDGRELAAVRGILASVMDMIKGGATHLAVLTDHVIESFRNELWLGCKIGEGIEPDWGHNLHCPENALSADDALAAAAVAAARGVRVGRVIICARDKDLAPCVRGTRIVRLIG
jgi:hypothetical protein